MTTAVTQVPPFNTTLLGVVRAVADHFGLPHSDAALYGGSGHAFLINIHEQLCPSGPYCWNRERFRVLLRNLGIEMTDHGFFGAQGSPETRAGVEALLRSKLDDGTPCSLLNMENQLLTGYDATGFHTTQPWPPHDFPPAHLTFGSWEELGGEVHLSFFSYARVAPAEPRAIALDAIGCALDMLRQPEAFATVPYAAGPAAYDNWIGAVEAGHGGEHGNWWNGTVWAECRGRAAEYLREVADAVPEVGTAAAGLATVYAEVAANLERASNKELAADTKAELLRRTQALERGTEGPLAQIRRILGSGGWLTGAGGPS